uniref:Uncharacterized protein n=1 Tax=Arundo donax TaxID=35708 RepID=A0A0A9FIA4_ARUDO
MAVLGTPVCSGSTRRGGEFRRSTRSAWDGALARSPEGRMPRT